MKEKICQEVAVMGSSVRAGSFGSGDRVPHPGCRIGGWLPCAGIAAMFGVSQLFKVLKIVIPLGGGLFPGFASAGFFFRRGKSQRAINQRIFHRRRIRHAMVQRTSGSIVDAMINTDFSSHPIGIGMGRGAAAVSALTTGKVQFVAGEYEFVREMIELGPFPGIAFSLFRFLLALILTFSRFKCAQRREPLALLLVTPLFATLCFGILEQPTDQGFMVICMAFTCA